MALDTRYSVLAGLLDPAAEERVRFLLDHLGFRLWHPALEKTTPDGRHAVLQGLREFREHLGGELTITLLSDIGVGVEVHEMDEAHDAEVDRLAERARRGLTCSFPDAPISATSPTAPISIRARPGRRFWRN